MRGHRAKNLREGLEVRSCLPVSLGVLLLGTLLQGCRQVSHRTGALR